MERELAEEDRSVGGPSLVGPASAGLHATLGCQVGSGVSVGRNRPVINQSSPLRERSADAGAYNCCAEDALRTPRLVACRVNFDGDFVAPIWVEVRVGRHYKHASYRHLASTRRKA